MKKAAIISLTIPEIPGKSGGEIRDIYLFQYIGEHYDTDYFSIHNYFGEGKPNQDFCRKFHKIYYPCQINEEEHLYVNSKVHLSLFEKLRYKLYLKGFYIPFCNLPSELLGFRNEFNRYVKNFLEKCAKEKQYDYIFISPQVNPAIVENLCLPSNTKIIWATYDVEQIRHTRLLETKGNSIKKFFYKNEIAAAIKYEKLAVKKSDGIVAVSELDRETFLSLYHIEDNKVLSIENGVDIEYFEAMNSEQNHKIVFVGNMGYAPNEQASIHFIKNVFPKIKEKYSDAEFYVVGTNANQKLMSLEGNGVIITGRVDDVREYLCLANVICVPLLAGSGTKYKVLEAMACEKAVVTTEYGAEGLDVRDKDNIMIANTTEDMVNSIDFLFKNKEFCDTLGKKARKFIVSQHAWNVVLPKLDGWIESLH